MNTSAVTNLIVGTAQDYGGVLLIIMGAVIVIGAGVLVFNIGWGAVKGVADDDLPKNQFGVGPKEQAGIQSSVDRKMRGLF